VAVNNNAFFNSADGRTRTIESTIIRWTQVNTPGYDVQMSVVNFHQMRNTFIFPCLPPSPATAVQEATQAPMTMPNCVTPRTSAPFKHAPPKKKSKREENYNRELSDVSCLPS